MKHNGFKLLDKLVDKLVDSAEDPGMNRIRPGGTEGKGPDSVGAFEAKTHLAELLERVAREGRSITITRRGVPVARLVPVDGALVRAPERLLGAFRAFQAAHSLGDVSTRELVDEGRRR